MLLTPQHYIQGSKNISIKMLKDVVNYLLTGLQNRETYNISIVTVQHFTSNAAIVLDITLGKNDVHCVQWKSHNTYIFLSVPVPGQPRINVTSISSTSISLSWSVLSGSVVTSYEMMW